MTTLASGGLRAALLAFALFVPGSAVAQATTTTTVEPVRVFNLEPGEKITARIVSSGAPETLTAKPVDAVIAADQAAAAPAATAEVAAAPAEPAAEESSQLWPWILLIVLLALIVYFLSRGKDDQKKTA